VLVVVVSPGTGENEFGEEGLTLMPVATLTNGCIAITVTEKRSKMTKKLNCDREDCSSNNRLKNLRRAITQITEEKDEHAWIENVFDKEERSADQGLQTKLFAAKKKNRWQKEESATESRRT